MIKLYIMLQVSTKGFFGNGKGKLEGSFVDNYFTDPIYQNIGVISKFVWVLIGMMALIAGLNVYKKYNHGEQDAQDHAYRWGAAIVAALFVGGLLQYIAISQTEYAGREGQIQQINANFK